MAPTPPASWYPDPTGEHEHRYWDGRNWTEHVASRGQQTVDPVKGVHYPRVDPAGPAPGWYPDPLGLHERRYWDGHAWTDHIGTSADQTPRDPADPHEGNSKATKSAIDRQVRRVGNTAPAGGGTLFSEQVLVVNQTVKKFGSGIGYAVYDQKGVQLGAIQEVRRDLGTKMSDNFRGRNEKSRAYRFNVVDMDGRVLLGMTRPELWFTSRSTMVVEDSIGVPIGQITQESHGLAGTVAGATQAGVIAAKFLTQKTLGGATGMVAGTATSLVAQPIASKTRRRLKVGHAKFGLEANGERLGSILAASNQGWEFSICDAGGSEIGRITKTWAGWAKETFTKSDNYVVQMHRPLADPLLPLVIAAALAIDIALKQGNPTSGTGSGRRYR